MSQEFVSGGFVAKARRGGALTGSGVRYTGLALPSLPRAMSQAAQEAMIAVALWWRENRSPIHFSIRAYDQYGNREPYVYEERDGKPKWMNYDKGGWSGISADEEMQGSKVRPLYRSGRLRQAIVNGPYTVKASGSGRTLKVKAYWPGLPRYTYAFDPNFRQRTGKRPLVHNKVAEITIVTPQEVEMMRKVYEKELGKIMKQMESRGMAA